MSNTSSPEGFIDAAASPAAPVVPTTQDRLGVERIAGPVQDGWEPAPTEATDEAKARMDEVNSRLAGAKQDRLDAHTRGDTDETAQPLIDANESRDSEEDEARKTTESDTPDDSETPEPPAAPATPAPYGSGERA